jgi:cell division protein FtsB
MAKKGIIILLLCLLLYLFLFSGSGYIRRRRFEDQIRRVRSEIESLKEENKKLEALIQRLRNDPLCIEEWARGYGMLRRGEVVVLFRKPSS